MLKLHAMNLFCGAQLFIMRAPFFLVTVLTFYSTPIVKVKCAYTNIEAFDWQHLRENIELH